MWVVDCIYAVNSSNACRDEQVDLLRPQSFTTLVRFLSVVVHSASLCLVTNKDEWANNNTDLSYKYVDIRLNKSIGLFRIKRLVDS